MTQTLRRILAPEVLQRPGPRGPRHGGAPLRNQRRAPPTWEEKRQRFEALSAAVHKLQTEAFLSREDLDALPLAQLKVLCYIISDASCFIVLFCQDLQCMPPSVQGLIGNCILL